MTIGSQKLCSWNPSSEKLLNVFLATNYAFVVYCWGPLDHLREPLTPTQGSCPARGLDLMSNGMGRETKMVKTPFYSSKAHTFIVLPTYIPKYIPKPYVEPITYHLLHWTYHLSPFLIWVSSPLDIRSQDKELPRCKQGRDPSSWIHLVPPLLTSP